MMVNFLKQSKLRSLPNNLSGIKSQGFFTSWCWNMLGLFFFLMHASFETYFQWECRGKLWLPFQSSLSASCIQTLQAEHKSEVEKLKYELSINPCGKRWKLLHKCLNFSDTVTFTNVPKVVIVRLRSKPVKTVNFVDFKHAKKRGWNVLGY